MGGSDQTGGLGLKRTWAKGISGSVDGFLDDYAGMGLGLLSLYAATGEVNWYTAAEKLIRAIPDRFEDADGTLYTSSGADLFKRPRDLFDNPSPSGTSMAAEAMLWLSLYTGETELRTRAESYLRQLAALFSRYPTGAGYGLAVATSLQLGTKELALVGNDRGSLAAVYWKTIATPHRPGPKRRSRTIDPASGRPARRRRWVGLCLQRNGLPTADFVAVRAGAVARQQLSGEPDEADPDQVGHQQVE